jgi:hypothetical protein
MLTYKMFSNTLFQKSLKYHMLIFILCLALKKIQPKFYKYFRVNIVSATSCFTEGHTPPYLLLKLTGVLTDVITYVLTDV